jgi:hypothetical protein
LSRHYLSKGESLKSNISSSSAKSALTYFEWAKEMVIRANQLAETQFKDQLNYIEKYKSRTEKSIRLKDFDNYVNHQMQSCTFDENLESVAVIFIVGLEVKTIQLNSDIARLITCTTNDQVMPAIMNMKLVTPIIVSSTLPSNDILSGVQLLHYYHYSESNKIVQVSMENDSNVTCVNSIDQLISLLYHKLGQYYRDGALQAAGKSKDREKAKRLLEKSTQCYKLLANDTEEILKRYAVILKNQEILKLSNGVNT